MSEQSIHNRSSDGPDAGSAPIFIFHGDVHGFVYSANPQGNVIGCMINSAPSTSPSGTPRSEGLRRRNTRTHAAHAQSASQTSLNLRAESVTSFQSTPTFYYDLESVEGASTALNRDLPTGDSTNLIDESQELLLFLFDMYRRVLIWWFFQLGKQNAPLFSLGYFLQY